MRVFKKLLDRDHGSIIVRRDQSLEELLAKRPGGQEPKTPRNRSQHITDYTKQVCIDRQVEDTRNLPLRLKRCPNPFVVLGSLERTFIFEGKLSDFRADPDSYNRVVVFLIGRV